MTACVFMYVLPLLLLMETNVITKKKEKKTKSSMRGYLWHFDDI